MLAPNTDPRTVPSVQNLITILRDRTLWPVGFEWYYGDAHTCALGIMCKMGWMDYHPGGLRRSARAAQVLEITHQQAREIFVGGASVAAFIEVTPEHVASALEHT